MNIQNLKKIIIKSEKRLVVWIVGCWGSGKTTQAFELCEFFGNGKPKVFGNTKDFLYTRYGRTIACIGKLVNKNNLKNGADTLSFFIRKSSLVKSIKKMNRNAKISILENGKWQYNFLDFIPEIIIGELVIVFLKTDFNKVVQRMSERKSKTYKNVKNINTDERFLRLVERMKKEVIKENKLKELCIEKGIRFFEINNNVEKNSVSKTLIKTILKIFFERNNK